ncbi:hypothetical protein Emag_004815 [Eimeria magna]
MAPLRSLTSRISQQVWGRVHMRVGGRGQVRVNKGFKPQAFDTLGNALFFARWSKHLRAATVGQFVKSNVSPEAAAEISNPGSLASRIRPASGDRKAADSATFPHLLTSGDVAAGKALAGSAYVRQIEVGEITPSFECQQQLEKIVGAPLTPPRKRIKRPKL